jgi:hypothetical protein
MYPGFARTVRLFSGQCALRSGSYSAVIHRLWSKHSAHVRSVTGQAATTADYADDPARSGGSNAQTASIEAGKSAHDPVDGGYWTAKGRLWPRHVTGVNAYALEGPDLSGERRVLGQQVTRMVTSDHG